MTGRPLILIEPGAPEHMAGPGWIRRRAEGRSMGTGWRLAIWSPPGTEGLLPDPQAEVRAACEETIAIFSPWKADSALTRFNHAAPGWHDLPPALMDLLKAALHLSDQTGGAVDPCLGRLSDLWGFGPSGPVQAAPNTAALEAARAASGRERLKLRGAQAYQPGGLWLDFGGIAKGWAVDRASARLSAAGHGVHMIEIGGEVAARGLSPEGQPWWVALDGPPGLALPAARAALHRGALAGSGHWARRCGPGAGWSHTIDPVSGRTFAGEVLGVHVFHDSAALADAWASALMLLPEARGLALARHHGIRALLTLQGGRRAGTLPDLAEAA
ncbi:FAD:protein FMN transferase [Pseudooceanicola sp. HF7]|uniref:FAD:protein FMN transferase n=1 Tax=Pseudooceanicola sp. HF7 TaxID=2721560 RepID=UPI0014311D48|nr:FAD:protein FMN transferase [Pseudooceanicola sp. HF7]NIZ11344.1 FAD:protein FMN transferase [Pseudooceanicola sp. HF7]